MLQNAYFLAKIGADTAENEQHFAKILPKTGNYPTGPPGRRSGPLNRCSDVGSIGGEAAKEKSDAARRRPGSAEDPNAVNFANLPLTGSHFADENQRQWQIRNGKCYIASITHKPAILLN